MSEQKDFKSQKTGYLHPYQASFFFAWGYKFKLRHLLNCFPTPATDTEYISYMSLPDPLSEDSSCIDHSKLQEVKFLSVMLDELIEG